MHDDELALVIAPHNTRSQHMENRIIGGPTGADEMILIKNVMIGRPEITLWATDKLEMQNTAKPFADVAQRLLWHRMLMEMSQQEYAARIGAKRSAYSLWEAGSHRLSLNGALSLQQAFGLSLDFLYLGIDDALPMTLRNAWRDWSSRSS